MPPPAACHEWIPERLYVTHDMWHMRGSLDLMRHCSGGIRWAVFINYYSEDELWDTMKVKLKYNEKPQQKHTGRLHQELSK